MYQYLLFDLDGTLTDPKIGITTCVQYALRHFNIQEENLDILESFIGPPLRESFAQFYGFTPEQTEEAVAKYRERYSTAGLYENEIYEGMPELLAGLAQKGICLAIASSKPEVFVRSILEYFNIAQYFTEVVGSELDGTRDTKEEVVQEALHRLFGSRQPVSCVMIGDRKFDIQGAKAFSLDSIGVAYGYGSIAELQEAGADHIAETVGELRELLFEE